MTKQIWHDKVTGTHYSCEQRWIDKVNAHLASQLAHTLNHASDLRLAANHAARFWKEEYYQQIFPLRFGITQQAGLFGANDKLLFTEQEVILDGTSTTHLRKSFMDGSSLPPILPDLALGKDGWLQADRLLVEAACINVLMAQHPDMDDIRQAARLAALTYPFQAQLQHIPIMQGKVQEIIDLFLARRENRNLYESLKTIYQQLNPGPCTNNLKIGMVVVSVQRVKTYVFETPGLNEIRGASTMLDKVTEKLAIKTGNEIGPEVVLRAAGSTLMFLAPDDQDLVDRPSQLRRYIFEKTEMAFATAAKKTVSLQTVLDKFDKASRKLFDKLNQNRAQSRLPRYVTYPFENRCNICQTRAASDWRPDSNGENIPLCTVCIIKRETGRKGRRGKVHDILVDLDVLDNDSHSNKRPTTLAVKGQKSNEWMAQDLESLVPPSARRKLIGVVYADGNNFGAVALNIDSIALGLQWTARIEQTTRAAAAIALGKATQQMAQQQGWQPGEPPIFEKVPFQILAMGGDDVSLFAWAPVAMHFAAEFTRLTDLEFQATSKCRLRPDDTLHFSAGVLATDEKTPVLKSVHFAEEELLKWAKQANKAKKLPCGNIATLYAETAESVPADLDDHRRHIYLLGLGNQFELCTTLRPYTASELQALLELAETVRNQGNLGRLERLVSAFYGARQGAFAGMLHYAYQKGRMVKQPDGGWIAKLESEMQETMQKHQNDLLASLLIDYKLKEDPHHRFETPFGVERKHSNGKPPPTLRFSPLWDLLELTKTMT